MGTRRSASLMRRISDNPAETIIPHGKIDDDHVGSMVAEKLIACRNIACFEDSRDSSVLQNAAASLKHDGMVIDNEDLGHTFYRLKLATYPNARQTRTIPIITTGRRKRENADRQTGQCHTIGNRALPTRALTPEKLRSRPRSR